MPFNLLNCTGVTIMSMVAGSVDAKYTFMPFLAAFYWTSEPLYAAFVAMVLSFIFGYAIKISKAWR